MKNSNEWLSDIEDKLQERYRIRKQRRKNVVRISGGMLTCSVVLLAVLTIPNLLESPTLPDMNSNIIIDSEDLAGESTKNNIIHLTTEKKDSNIFEDSTIPTDNHIVEKPVETEKTTVAVTEKPTNTLTHSHERTTEKNNNSDDNSKISSTEAPNPVVIPTEPPVSIPPIIEPPVTEQPTEPVTTVQLDFKVNRITNQISGAPPYYPPEMYEQKIWSHQEVTDYYGIDINDIHGEVFGNDDYTTQYCDGYGYITDRNGNIAKDTVSSSYIASDNSIVTISASRVSLPYDCCYELESNETNNINGIDVLIGGMSLSGNLDVYDFFYADFHKNGINYRFEARISAEKFYAIIENYIAL